MIITQITPSFYLTIHNFHLPFRDPKNSDFMVMLLTKYYFFKPDIIDNFFLQFGKNWYLTLSSPGGLGGGLVDLPLLSVVFESFISNQIFLKFKTCPRIYLGTFWRKNFFKKLYLSLMTSSFLDTCVVKF